MKSLLLSLADLKTDRRKGYGDSNADQLNCCITPILLILCATLVVAQYFFVDPIECYCPAHFSESQVDYTKKVCWATRTYRLKDMNKSVKNKDFINYYQWVSLILIGQAALFRLPRPIWRQLSKKSGIAVSTITNAAIEYQLKTNSDELIKYTAKHMGQYLLDLNHKTQMTKKCCNVFLKFYGNFLAILYILIKCVYVLNVLGQLWMLNSFLGPGYTYYGLEILRQVSSGEDWQRSYRFPKATFCDVDIHRLGNIHRYTIQCALPLNVFNQIIFILVWFWFVFVAAATIGSLLLWIFWAVNMRGNIKHIASRLIAMDEHSNIKARMRKDKGCINAFVTTFLRRDGCFILRMVQKNASDIIATQFLVQLWNYYQDHSKQLHRMPSVDQRMLNDALDSDEDFDISIL